MCIEHNLCVICLNNIIQVSSLSCLCQYLWTPTWSSWSRPKRMPTFLEQGSSVCRRSGQDVKFAFWTEDISVLTCSSKMFSGKIPTSCCLCTSTVKSLSQLPMNQVTDRKAGVSEKNRKSIIREHKIKARRKTCGKKWVKLWVSLTGHPPLHDYTWRSCPRTAQTESETRDSPGGDLSAPKTSSTVYPECTYSSCGGPTGTA